MFQPEVPPPHITGQSDTENPQTRRLDELWPILPNRSKQEIQVVVARMIASRLSHPASSVNSQPRETSDAR